MTQVTKGFAIANELANGWYNAGQFGIKAQARMFDSVEKAQATANVVSMTRKVKVRIFHISESAVREVVGAFSDTFYRPAR
ncbi:MAG: hypothetical protein EBY39_06080 [Flavobacteriia bacterium]|nr:hypothetical protein [Flavobacteriia bacterium]